MERVADEINSKGQRPALLEVTIRRIRRKQPTMHVRCLEEVAEHIDQL
jgi:hypothetical protein